MSIEVFNCEQGTPEWIEMRLGIQTASEFSCVQAKGRDGGASKTRRAYMLRLADEIIYRDQPVETFTNPNLERGHEYEPEARDIYALMHDVELERVGFIRNGKKGCSPDSLIGKDGILEVKTTFPRLLAELQLDDEFPSQHKAQCQGELWICERTGSISMSIGPGASHFSSAPTAMTPISDHSPMRSTLNSRAGGQPVGLKAYKVAA